MRYSSPLLSVCLLTYNHGKFIAQAIEGILTQKTDFPIEVHVLEDCSTDNTREIILHYHKQYPELLKLHLASKNRGGKKNFLKGFQYIKTPYFAILDGDDYWTDPSKLQTQVDFLQTNPEFVGAAHNVQIIYSDIDLNPTLVCRDSQKEILTIDDIVTTKFYMHNSCMVYRNVFNGKLPRYFLNHLCGDWFLSIIHAAYGPIRYFNKTMSVYRQHAGGCWSAMGQARQSMFQADAIMLYDRILKGQFRPAFFRVARQHLNNLLPGLENISVNWLTQQKYKTLAKYLEAYERGTKTSSLYYGAFRLLDNQYTRFHVNFDSPHK